MGIVKSTLQLISSRILKSVVGFVAVVVFSREAGASPLGTYYPFLALIGLLSIPSSFGINGAVEKRISEGNETSKYLASGLAIKIPLAACICIIVLLFRDYVKVFLGSDLVFLLIITLFIDQIGRFSIFVLRGELRVGETALVEISRPLSWLVFGYVFYNSGYGVRGLIYGYLIGTIFIFLIGWWKVSTPIGQPTIKHTRSLVDFGKYSTVLHLGGSIFSWIDVFILSSFVATSALVTRADVGAYENAWRLSLITVLVSRSISTVVFPRFSQWDSEDSTDLIENIIPKAAFPSLLIVIPAFVGTVVLANDLLRVLFGPEFTVAATSLIIISAGMVLQSIHGLVSEPLKAIDRPDLAAYATVVGITTNIVLNLLLIWQFGIVGAAAATAISFTVNTLVHIKYLREFLHIKLPYREAGWATVASIVMGVVVWWVRSLASITSILHLTGVIAVGCLVYIALILTYPPIRYTTRQFIQKAV